MSNTKIVLKKKGQNHTHLGKKLERVSFVNLDKQIIVVFLSKSITFLNQQKINRLKVNYFV